MKIWNRCKSEDCRYTCT